MAAPLHVTQPTHIDRHQCRRVVPMKVLALGVCRTGTLSLRTALKELGYEETYHMANVVENPPDSDFWIEAFQAKYRDGKPFGKEKWDQLLGHCMAVTDLPAIAFAPELIAAYPDAKVILTNRDIDSWMNSTQTCIENNSNDKAWQLLALFNTDLRRFVRMGHLQWDCLIGGNLQANGRDWFERHYHQIRELVPKDNLLEYSVKDGWKPLCEFLQKDMPQGPFPRVNDSELFNDCNRRRKKAFLDDALRKIFSSLALCIVVSLVGFRYGWSAFLAMGAVVSWAGARYFVSGFDTGVFEYALGNSTVRVLNATGR